MLSKKQVYLALVFVALFCAVDFLMWMKRKTTAQQKVFLQPMPTSKSRLKQTSGIKTRITHKEIPPCGQICSYQGKKQPGSNESYYQQLFKNVNCENILGRMAWEQYKIEYPPPKKPPPELILNYTVNGKCPITSYKYENSVVPSTVNKNWTIDLIEEMQSTNKEGKKISYYEGGRTISKIFNDYKQYIAGKEGFVIGTIKPWLEAMLLNNNAQRITTLEYSSLTISHPQISVLHPVKMAKKMLEGQARKFDFGTSFSSLEHSGLGRYGDPINPFGDLEAMAQAWCMIKPGGVFFLGVPVDKNQQCFTVWNLHRIYGKARLQHITANWELIKMKPCPDVHAVLVLKKREFNML